jgi:hypothetical protein
MIGYHLINKSIIIKQVQRQGLTEKILYNGSA